MIWVIDNGGAWSCHQIHFIDFDDLAEEVVLPVFQFMSEDYRPEECKVFAKGSLEVYSDFKRRVVHWRDALTKLESCCYMQQEMDEDFTGFPTPVQIAALMSNVPDTKAFPSISKYIKEVSSG